MSTTANIFMQKLLKYLLGYFYHLESCRNHSIAFLNQIFIARSEIKEKVLDKCFTYNCVTEE